MHSQAEGRSLVPDPVEWGTARPYFTWRDEWDLAVDFMDEDHRALADLLNATAARFAGTSPSGLATDDGDAPTELLAALEDLGHHTREHFQREEAMMRDIDYPRLEAHKSEHDLLLAEFTLMVRATRARGTGRLDLETLDALKSWLMGHVLDADRELAEYCAARRPGERRPDSPT